MDVRRCVLKSYPTGRRRRLSADNFQFETSSVDFALRRGEVLVELLYISVDPYMRSRFVENGPTVTYDRIRPPLRHTPFQIGEPIESGCIARVVSSKHADYPAGTVVAGMLPWETCQVIGDPGDKLNILPVDDDDGDDEIPASYHEGVLGLTGLTAYLSFQHAATPVFESRDGPVVLVSGAAGAVGHIFAQLCCDHYYPVMIGAVSSDEKVQFCRNLCYDCVFNYKKRGIEQGLDEALEGRTIDLYFDTVGGEVLDHVLLRMSEKGLILSCGAMSLLDGAESNYALKNWGMVQRKALTIQGFNVMQWASEFPTAVQELRGMLAEGRLLAHETVLTGFDQVVEGLLGLFRGDNTGKMIISLERD